MASTTPTPFSWPSGPQHVQVSGDWDKWTEKIDLDKQADGSFSKQIPLPSNTKVHYKFIVDGNWTTSSTSPLIDDAGNQNNVVEVGPAPLATEAVSSKAGEVGAGVVAGVSGAAVAAGAAATKFVDHVNGNADETGEAEPKKELSQAEKVADPAAALKTSADEDIRNHVPTSITSATHAAAPVLAGAIATVTGADILRGNAEALPVTEKEIKETQAEALKGDNAALASRLEPQGGAISDPKAATTENAQAAASVANSATVGAPIVPVTNNGFAANVTGATGSLTTAADAGKEGGDKAGAVAAASSGALGASVAGASAVNGTAKTESKENKSMAAPLTTAPDSKSPASGAVASKAEADLAAAPAAAASSSPAVAAGTGATTPTRAAKPLGSTTAAATSQDKSLPVTPTKKAPAKGDTVKDKARYNTVSGGKKKNAPVEPSTSEATGAITPDSAPGTPDRKRKQSLFGKIKSALSPHSSPSK